MPRETFFNLPADKRDRVVEAALDAFAASSYGEVSISRIAASAGIAKGSFYQYFDGKLDLYRHLVVDVMGARKLAFLRTEPQPEGADFFAALGHAMRMGLRFGLAHPRLAAAARSVVHETPDAELAGLRAETRRMGEAAMRTMLAQGQASGWVRADLDLDLAAQLLLALMQTGLDNAVRGLTGLDVIDLCAAPERSADLDDAAQRRLVDGIVDLLRRGLGTGEAAPGGPDLLDLDAVAAIYRETDR